MTPQLTANWHPNFGSQLIHPFQKIHMFRDPPKKQRSESTWRWCAFKNEPFWCKQVWKKRQYWPVPIYLFAILKKQKKHHQPSTLWLDVLFRLIRSPLFRVAKVAKNRRTHRNKSNENASSFKREQHEKNLLAYLLTYLLTRLLPYLLTFSIILRHSMVHRHGPLKINSPTQDLVMVG